MSVAHKTAQRAEYLVFTAKIGEFTREENSLAAPAGDPILDPLAKCLSPMRHSASALQKPDIQYRKKPDIFQ
jgi:hypothetical protein